MNSSRSSDRRCHELAAQVMHLLARGVPLSQETLHFLQSTYGIETAADLDLFLDQEPDCEQESLLECVLYPDVSTRCQIEPLLGRERFEAADIQATAQIVAEHRVQAALTMPGEDPVQVELTMPLASAFIARLKIHHRLPSDLVHKVHEAVRKGLRERVLVRLRDLRVQPDEGALRFLDSFFRAFPSTFFGFEACLDFVCRLLEEKQPGTDVFTHLILTKLLLEKSLDKAEHLESLMARQPLEAILMQRTSILSINRPRIREQLQMIDDLGLRIFGSTPESTQLQSSFALHASPFQRSL